MMHDGKFNEYDINYRRIYYQALKNAQARGKEFTLTFEEFERLVKRADGKCMVSGLRFSHRGYDSRSPFGPSLDRVDSNIGYTKANVRLVCLMANYALNVWDDEPLHIFCRAVHYKTLRERVARRKKREPLERELFTTPRLFLKSIGFNNQDHEPALYSYAVGFCGIAKISTPNRHVPTYQRKDGSWGTTQAKVFPLSILKLCHDRLMIDRHFVYTKKEGELLLQTRVELSYGGRCLERPRSTKENNNQIEKAKITGGSYWTASEFVHKNNCRMNAAALTRRATQMSDKEDVPWYFDIWHDQKRKFFHSSILQKCAGMIDQSHLLKEQPYATQNL